MALGMRLVLVAAGGVFPCAASWLRQSAHTPSQSSPPDRSRTAEAEKLSATPADPQQQHTANGTVQRARLDVGFSDFEKKLLAQVGARIRASASGGDWTQDLRERCVGNVTAELGEGLRVQLAPLKQSIGKTWMALPKDEQKNAYVDQLKTAFLPVLGSYETTMDSHLNISLQRMQGYSKPPRKLQSTQLLSKCQTMLKDSLVGEHCYEDKPKLNSTPHLPEHPNVSAVAKSIAMAQTGNDAAREAAQFCIPSVVQGLAHRLNDTQGLISMSMRFDAGAMALAQKGTRKPAAK